jgi:hypothetical protein
VAATCEYGKEPSGSIKMREKDSAPRSKYVSKNTRNFIISFVSTNLCCCGHLIFNNTRILDAV